MGRRGLTDVLNLNVQGNFTARTNARVFLKPQPNSDFFTQAEKRTRIHR